MALNSKMKKGATMMNKRMFWEAEWQDRLRNLKMAEDDLECDEVESNEMIDFYAEAVSQALNDVLLFPVSDPRKLAIKMHLLKDNECLAGGPERCAELWSALFRDLDAIARVIDRPGVARRMRTNNIR
jgi:hypothetical protein